MNKKNKKKQERQQLKSSLLQLSSVAPSGHRFDQQNNNQTIRPSDNPTN